MARTPQKQSSRHEEMVEPSANENEKDGDSARARSHDAEPDDADGVEDDAGNKLKEEVREEEVVGRREEKRPLGLFRIRNRRARFAFHPRCTEGQVTNLTPHIETHGGVIIEDDERCDVLLVPHHELDRVRVIWASSPTVYVESLSLIRVSIQSRKFRLSTPEFKRMPGRPVGQPYRVEFSPEDIEHLCEYLALKIPVKALGGRTGHNVYEDLVDEASPPDGRRALAWALRHPWQSWRNYYKRHQAVLDPRIDYYVVLNPPMPNGKGQFKHRRFPEQHARRAARVPTPNDAEDEEEYDQVEGHLPRGPPRRQKYSREQSLALREEEEDEDDPPRRPAAGPSRLPAQTPPPRPRQRQSMPEQPRAERGSHPDELLGTSRRRRAPDEEDIERAKRRRTEGMVAIDDAPIEDALMDLPAHDIDGDAYDLTPVEPYTPRRSEAGSASRPSREDRGRRGMPVSSQTTLVNLSQAPRRRAESWAPMGPPPIPAPGRGRGGIFGDPSSSGSGAPDTTVPFISASPRAGLPPSPPHSASASRRPPIPALAGHADIVEDSEDEDAAELLPRPARRASQTRGVRTQRVPDVSVPAPRDNSSHRREDEVEASSEHVPRVDKGKGRAVDPPAPDDEVAMEDADQLVEIEAEQEHTPDEGDEVILSSDEEFEGSGGDHRELADEPMLDFEDEEDDSHLLDAVSEAIAGNEDDEYPEFDQDGAEDIEDGAVVDTQSGPYFTPVEGDEEADFDLDDEQAVEDLVDDISAGTVASAGVARAELDDDYKDDEADIVVEGSEDEDAGGNTAASDDEDIGDDVAALGDEDLRVDVDATAVAPLDDDDTGDDLAMRNGGDAGSDAAASDDTASGPNPFDGEDAANMGVDELVLLDGEADSSAHATGPSSRSASLSDDDAATRSLLVAGRALGHSAALDKTPRATRASAQPTQSPPRTAHRIARAVATSAPSEAVSESVAKSPSEDPSEFPSQGTKARALVEDAKAAAVFTPGPRAQQALRRQEMDAEEGAVEPRRSRRQAKR